jgi:hypothetical protein
MFNIGHYGKYCLTKAPQNRFFIYMIRPLATAYRSILHSAAAAVNER